MDEFDEVVGVEHEHLAEGESAGVAHGERQGFDDAQDIGWGFGFETGREVGFYRGVAEAVLELAARHGLVVDERALSTARTLLAKIDAFAAMHPTDEELQSKLQVIRAKAKVLVARSKIPVQYSETEARMAKDESF